MEIKHTMNTIITASLQAQSNEGNIAISAATAVFAWCETRDEAASEWLLNKYRPLVAQVVARETRDAALRAYLVEEALRVALAEIDADMAISNGDAWFVMIAKEVSQQAMIDTNELELLAA